MSGTIIDTTSLIALAACDNSKNNWFSPRHMGKDSTALSGIEALIISDNIIIDYPSYDRNIKKYPQLSQLSAIANFINTNAKDEDECYERCADVIVPMMNRPGDFLVDMHRRHISEIDYCELSVNGRHFAPSTYWRDLSGRLSQGENSIVKSLESKLGEHTPFSGAALTNLIRFLYYTICQDIHESNLSLHFMKSSWLTGIGRLKLEGEERTAKSIIDVFDEDVSSTFKDNLNKWIGKDNLEMDIPILANFVQKNRSKDCTFIEDLIRIRNFKACKNFRSGIKSLQDSLEKKDSAAVKETIGGIEKYVNDVKSGLNVNPGQNSHKIAFSIPFVGGLGTEINIRIPKYRKSPKDKILTFLHQAAF